MEKPTGSDDISLIIVLLNNCIPMRMDRATAMSWIKEFAEGTRYKHYQCPTSVCVGGDYVIGMFIQELAYDQRTAAQLNEELLRRQVERERRERDLLGDEDDGD